jgi:hypothetical protein
MSRPAPGPAAFTVRPAHADDLPALYALAALDSQPPPPFGPMLLAEVEGELWAAVSIPDRTVAIADPFRPTAELVRLLRERAGRLAQSEERRPTRARKVREIVSLRRRASAL